MTTSGRIGDHFRPCLGRRRFVTGLIGTAAGSAMFPAVMAYGQEAAVEMRSVEHAHGMVDIPLNPQRVVIVSHKVTDMQDLEIPLIGARNLGREQRMFPELAGRFEGIFDLGNSDLDLEDVINLQPDLIVGRSPGDDDTYDRFVQIAPTVLLESGDETLDPNHKAKWETKFAQLANMLGKEARARELLDAWDARVAHFRARLVEKGLEGTTVSLVSISRSVEVDLFTRASHPGGILEKIGLKRPPSQDFDGSETLVHSNGGDTSQYDISPERLNEADADVMIFWGDISPNPLSDPEGEARTTATGERVVALTQSPIWQTIGAVREGRAHQVSGLWGRADSRLGADSILDDLYRYVLQEEPPA